MTLPILRTKRLILRPWESFDLPSFAEFNGDPQVMEFYPSVLDRKESDFFAKKIQEHIQEHGFGFWAVEAPSVAPFIGYLGLNFWNLKMPFAPCIDIGWRFGAKFWGKGYATEGAKEAMRYAFEELKLQKLFSMATIDNFRSRRVMEKLGMKTDPKDNFQHPMLPLRHALSWRVLYHITQNQWLQERGMRCL